MSHAFERSFFGDEPTPADLTRDLKDAFGAMPADVRRHLTHDAWAQMQGVLPPHDRVRQWVDAFMDSAALHIPAFTQTLTKPEDAEGDTIVMAFMQAKAAISETLRARPSDGPQIVVRGLLEA